MKRIIFWLTLIIVILFLVLPAFSKTNRKPPSAKRDVSKLLKKINYSNEVLVYYKKSSASKIRQSVKKLSYVKAIAPIGKKAKGVAFEKISVNSNITAKKAANKIKRIPGVLAAAPNYFRRIFYSPTDASYDTTNWPIKAINVDDAWNTGETGGWLNNSVRVAVLDTGIDTDHEDLQNKLWANSGETPGNSIDDDGNGYVDDVNGVNFTPLSNYPDFTGNWDTKNYSWTYPMGSNYPEEYVKTMAQEITGNGTSVSRIGFLVTRYGRPRAMKVSIRSSLNGSDLASAVITKDDVPTIYKDEEEEIGEALVDKSLSNSLTLTNGTKYYIVLTTNNKSYEKAWYLEGMSGYNTYASGDIFIKQEDSWMPFLNSDLVFYLDAYNNNIENDDVVGGHGTYVSGIIAAEHNNVGIAGISPGAEIMSVKVVDKNGTGSDGELIAGITYAVDNGAKVINLSLGGIEKSSALQAAINYAYNNGVVVVAAAGNTGDSTVEYPAACNNVLSVSATTSNSNKIAGFSSYNKYVDVSAPGQFINSTVNTGIYNANWVGTSISTPHVSGVAALLIAQNPTWSVDRIMNRIIATSKDVGDPWRDDKYGYGLLDAQAATGTTESSLISSRSSLILSYGRTANISGNLKGGGWPPATGLASQKIWVWISMLGAPFEKYDSFNTDSSGNFNYELESQLFNTSYRFTWDGNSSYQKALKELTVKVRPRITMRTSSNHLKVGRKVVLSGDIMPYEIYASKVIIQRSKNRHDWTNIETAGIREGTSYRKKIKLKKGTYYYRALMLTHRDHYEGFSRPVRIRVY